ncbi:MAG: hypothetical protein GF330_06290 [Candidatus Eisenbacteria bacterium]|nr:hypothetical protein [Candidatus Eisenbacteria bacterium]
MRPVDAILRPGLLLTLAVAVAAIRPTMSLADLEGFESYEPGSFPAPIWQDVGLVDPEPPNPPDPSATVEWTADAQGVDTRALFVAEAVAKSQGIYQRIEVRPRYVVTADIRVDRFCDLSEEPYYDWAMGVSVGRYMEDLDPAHWPQVQIYASSFDHHWRLYGAGMVSGYGIIDLEAPVELGRWYRVQTVLVVETGLVHSRIWDLASGALLVDRADSIPDWIPEDGQFDALIACEGELSADVTLPNLAALDNLQYSADPSDVREPAARPIGSVAIRLSSNPVGRDGSLSWRSEPGAMCTLDLCDAQGRRVVRRHFFQEGVGLQSIGWDAFLGERRVPSGVYFLHLEGDSQATATRQILILD